MSPTDITLVIAVSGFFASVITSALVAGIGLGSMRKDIEYIKRDLGIMMTMFTLTPVKHPDSK